jgi:flagellar biosynthesis regulator FlbT
MEGGQQIYETIRNTLTHKVRTAREEWINSDCKEVEDNLSQGKVEDAYRTVRSYFKEFHVKVMLSEVKKMKLKRGDGKSIWKNIHSGHKILLP